MMLSRKDTMGNINLDKGMKKIIGKITKVNIVEDSGLEFTVKIDKMNEAIQRPEMLSGTTYKVKPPTSDHALYVTINDITLNAGTEHETQRPFEIFINSKNMDQFQWVVALTRVISAVFRKGGDATFLVAELKDTFDPKGGYFRKGGKFMTSVVAEIGDILEKHFIKIGLLNPPELSAEVEEAIAKKTEEACKKIRDKLKAHGNPGRLTMTEENPFPENCTLCPKCSVLAVALLDGCATCLNCGDSKCG